MSSLKYMYVKEKFIADKCPYTCKKNIYIIYTE